MFVADRSPRVSAVNGAERPLIALDVAKPL
jgi:hypothetical protein